MDAEASSIFELDETKDELFIRLARGEKKDPVKAIRLKVGEGIAGWVVKSGQPMVVPDTSKEIRFSTKYDKITGFDTRSLICVPLTLKGKIMGAIQVLNKRSKEPFNNADLEILTIMSNQIAVAMENANLYSRLEKKFELTARELKLAQEELIRTERLAAMGNLVNGVAHEIRNPIMVIGGFAHRIKNLSDGNIEILKYSDIILTESARLERLVKKVKDLAAVQSASLCLTNLPPVIDQVLNTFKPIAAKQNVNVLTSLEKDLPLINMDPSQIGMALSNILENALESMSDTGTLELSVKRKEDDGIIMIIKDTGSGIDPEEMSSIYDPFVTSKTTGVGLGLTMVYQIISNHHGEIKITGNESGGTTVTILLPLTHDEYGSSG